jgi:hypothetical protein
VAGRVRGERLCRSVARPTSADHDDALGWQRDHRCEEGGRHGLSASMGRVLRREGWGGGQTSREGKHHAEHTEERAAHRTTKGD